jgi:hypothetical protein
MFCSDRFGVLFEPISSDLDFLMDFRACSLPYQLPLQRSSSTVVFMNEAVIYNLGVQTHPMMTGID